MQNTTLNKVLDIINRNELIDNLYNKLFELEINNKINTQEYFNILLLIKEERNKNINILNTIDIISNDMSNIYELIKDLNNYTNDNAGEYLPIPKTIKIKRLISHCIETSLERNDLPYDIINSLEHYITIQNQKFPLDEGLDILKYAGYEETADNIENICNQAKEKHLFNLILEDNINYYRMNLENNIMLDYLLEQIEKEPTIIIKQELIKSKYKMIGINKDLEEAFLLNHKNYSRTKFYETAIYNHYQKYPELFYDWNNYYREKINTILDLIYPRNKITYQNIKEIINDYLLSLKIKTYFTMILNPKDLDIILKDILIARDMAATQLDKTIINNLFYLNPELSLIKKLQKKHLSKV